MLQHAGFPCWNATQLLQRLLEPQEGKSAALWRLNSRSLSANFHSSFGFSPFDIFAVDSGQTGAGKQAIMPLQHLSASCTYALCFGLGTPLAFAAFCEHHICSPWAQAVVCALVSGYNIMVRGHHSMLHCTHIPFMWLECTTMVSAESGDEVISESPLPSYSFVFCFCTKFLRTVPICFWMWLVRSSFSTSIKP